MPDTEFWEPWVPQVGQRVRAVKRAECVCVVCGQDGHGPSAATRRQHREYGPAVGTVRMVVSPRFPSYAASCGHGGNRGHRFIVQIDHRRNPKGSPWPGWSFAAIELEPLEDTP